MYVKSRDVTVSSSYTEAGAHLVAALSACIAGAHGYMSECFTSRPEFLVPVPEALADTGFLVEPISNAVKALDLAVAARSTFE